MKIGSSWMGSVLMARPSWIIPSLMPSVQDLEKSFCDSSRFRERFSWESSQQIWNAIPVEVVFQSLDALPEGFTLNPGVWNHGYQPYHIDGQECHTWAFCRYQCWWFLWQESFQTLADGLKAIDGKQDEYCMVAYRLGNTLSDHGSVSRGVLQQRC